MANGHVVTIEELRETEDGDFNLIVEGYDAERDINFTEIVHFVNGGQVKGLCMDPQRTKLSSSCRQFIRTHVIRSVQAYRESQITNG